MRKMLFIGIALCLSMAATAMTYCPVQDDDVGKNELLIGDYKVCSFEYNYTIVHEPSFTYCQVELGCEGANVKVADEAIVTGLLYVPSAEYVIPPGWLDYSYSYIFIAQSTSSKPGHYFTRTFNTAISRGGTGLYDTTFDSK